MKIGRAAPVSPHHFYDMHFRLLDRLVIKVEREELGFNRRMFSDDFARLFVSLNRKNGKLFEVLSNDDDLTRRLIGNVNSRFANRSFDKSIRELVEEIAQSLIRFGTAYYFLHEDAERGDVHVGSFSSTGVVRLFGMLFQWIPKRKERNWDRDDEEFPREIRILDSRKVMCFLMPKAIERMLSAQNRTLAVLDQHLFGVTDSQPQVTHENPNPINHFDFSVWRNTQERALYRATRATGWNGRKYDASKRSDFFDIQRLIRFRRNQLVLRDEILRQLSAELSKVGKLYTADYTAKISGTGELPSVSHLNDLEARMYREEVGFTEIFDYCLTF